ncbi:splicing factor Cactin [Sitodiplosis mosellana]|uniref:splicing factor Cactin n=1 Tax=Sitodiplosis mosellana TaxID=263140 RepID=UPI0024443270|nr:splicing factor Cactin [Sitodiplosis mosellana]
MGKKSKKSHKKSSRRSSSASSSSSSDVKSRRMDDYKKSSSSKSHAVERSQHRSRSRSPHRSRDQSKNRSRDRTRDDSRGRLEKHSRDRSRGRSRDKSKKKDKKEKKSHKKKSKRSSSTDSNSSASSSSSLKLLQKLETKRIQEVLERKKQKELMKQMETPEEKRARRLKEKQAKELKRRERMGWDTEYQHYTNEDNPFGDANLTSTFMWKKKLEQKGLDNLREEEVEIINRQKQLENKAELEKVKKRRQERELEQQRREEEMAEMQRSREAAQFEEWERQEDQFHLEQARLRSKIRIQDGRAKPIDLLAQYVLSTQNLEETIEMQMHEPYTYLNGLSIEDLEDLLEDIRIYMEMDKSGENAGYWEDLIIIASDELQKLQKMELGNEYNATLGNREGINQSVARDVTSLFQGKTANQLDELKIKIESKINSKSDGVDIGYWESLLSQLKAHMARARLRDRHQESLRSKLALLKREQVEIDEQMQDESGNGEPSTSAIKRETSDNDHDENSQDMDDDDREAMDLLSDCFALYNKGNYSPEYLREEDIDSHIRVIDDDQLEGNIEKVRNRVLNRGDDDEEDFATKEEIRLAKHCRDALGTSNEEAEFSVETKLDNEVYLWSDKYRPRKPRYFNRVHTGFEWNKYNQTHYDMDNPPPKIVQGYKFNIFYPDLIDKSSTPQYFLTPCPDNKDFAVLRFHSGPPYEDLAFKIVNREWEFSYKRGFRCQFHNNIFQLWFHFKRYRYRR